MKVMVYDMVQVLFHSPRTGLHVLLAVSSVWPAVFTPDSPEQPLVLTLRWTTMTWLQECADVEFGRVLLWLCDWQPVLVGPENWSESAEQLVGLLKDADQNAVDLRPGEFAITSPLVCQSLSSSA